MDNQRLLIWAFFILLGWMTWQTWQQDYGPQPVQPIPEQGEQPIDVPATPSDTMPELDTTASAAPALPQAADSTDAVPGAQTITVRTDVLDVEINTVGGTLQNATLLRYPVAKDRPDQLVQLLDTSGTRLGLIESGVRAAGGAPEATHLVTFTADAQSFELGDADELIVPLTWRDASGVVVEKR